MAPKRSHSSLSRVSRDLNCVEEWVISVSNKAALNQLVVDDVLLDRVMAGWRPTHGESFPTPRGDELVMFEDYFYHGFGIPIHPFLHRLIEYYALSNLARTPSFMFLSSFISAKPILSFFHILTSSATFSI